MPAAIQSVPFRRASEILFTYSTVMGRPKVKLKSEKGLVTLLSNTIDQSLAGLCLHRVHHLTLKLLNWSKVERGESWFRKGECFLPGIFHCHDES